MTSEVVRFGTECENHSSLLGTEEHGKGKATQTCSTRSIKTECGCVLAEYGNAKAHVANVGERIERG